MKTRIKCMSVCHNDYPVINAIVRQEICSIFAVDFELL